MKVAKKIGYQATYAESCYDFRGYIIDESDRVLKVFVGTGFQIPVSMWLDKSTKATRLFNAYASFKHLNLSVEVCHSLYTKNRLPEYLYSVGTKRSTWSFYYKECREAALCWLMCAKRLPISKDVAPMIARLVYHMEMDWL